MADQSNLVDARKNKINELYQFINDPLLNLIQVPQPSYTHPLAFDGQIVQDAITNKIEESIYRPKRKAAADYDRIVKRSDTRTPVTLSNNKEQNDFLNKPIRDLEVLSIPESYPTKPHSVSSLAELYYLTQTLPLIKLLPGPHKVLISENYESALLEGKIAVLYSRIEELKRQGKWSLRQPSKHYDPFVYLKKTKKKQTHGLSLLEEARWMAADFKETAKFKKACCVQIAQAISDYWTYGDIMCIKAKPIVHIEVETEKEKEEVIETDDIKEPLETINEEVKEEVIDIDPQALQLVPPEDEQATFDLKSLLEPAEAKPQDIMATQTYKKPQVGTPLPFKLHVNIDDLKKIDQSIIKNLPKFTAFDEEEKTIKSTEFSMAPISRLIHPFDADDDWYKVVVKDADSSKAKRSHGPPEYQKGLFGFQSHRRFNYLKPPKPPLIKNIEYRSPTIWLPKDDKYLIHYIAEFCFNWELISEHLSSTCSSLKRYESNIERRTPWQCFERYIQLNEKFQFGDMRGSYAYHAQQWLEQAHRTQLTTKRRISPLGVGAESIQRGHRKLRWASMFDAMRKSMKKREIAQSKLNHRRSTAEYPNSNSTNTPTTSTPTNQVATINSGGNGGSAMSSPQFNGTKRSNDPVATPGELSKLKYENDKSSRKAYHDQAATRNRMMQAVSQQKPPGAIAMNARGQAAAAGAANLPPQSGTSPQSISADKAGIAPNVQMSKPGQSGQAQQIQAGASTMNKIPTNPNGTPYTPEQLQQLMNLQKQRRLMQQQQQNKTGMPANTTPANMMQGKQYNNVNMTNMPTSTQPARQNPPANGAKPRITFPPAQVSAIINSIQAKNPGLSKDQVTKLAATYLANLQQQQQNRASGRLDNPLPPPQGQMLQQQPQLQRSNSQQYRKVPLPQQGQLKQGQTAALTPQERNQLQMLKARTAQQQQLQQQQLQHQLQQQLLRQQQQQQQMLYPNTSPLMSEQKLPPRMGQSPNNSNIGSSQDSAAGTPNSRNS